MKYIFLIICCLFLFGCNTIQETKVELLNNTSITDDRGDCYLGEECDVILDDYYYNIKKEINNTIYINVTGSTDYLNFRREDCKDLGNDVYVCSERR